MVTPRSFRAVTVNGVLTPVCLWPSLARNAIPVPGALMSKGPVQTPFSNLPLASGQIGTAFSVASLMLGIRRVTIGGGFCAKECGS